MEMSPGVKQALANEHLTKERAVEILMEECDAAKQKAWQQGVGNGVAAGFVLGLATALVLSWIF